MRTKMQLMLLAAGTPTATSPDGADPARPGRPRRTTPLSQPKCLQPHQPGTALPRPTIQPATDNPQPTRCRSLDPRTFERLCINASGSPGQHRRLACITGDLSDEETPDSQGPSVPTQSKNGIAPNPKGLRKFPNWLLGVFA